MYQSLFVSASGIAVSQDPDTHGDAQEQDSQVDRVEPDLNQVFHFSFLLLELMYRSYLFVE